MAGSDVGSSPDPLILAKMIGQAFLDVVDRDFGPDLALMTYFDAMIAISTGLAQMMGWLLSTLPPTLTKEEFLRSWADTILFVENGDPGVRN